MRRLALVSAVAALAAVSSVSVAGAADRDTIYTRGRNGVRINELIFSTLRFAPERIRIDSGERVTVVHDDTSGEPHTITVVKEADLPTNVEEVFNCGPCGRALDAHFAENPPDPTIEDDRGDGEVGLDEPGDSLLFFPGETIKRRISAPAGTTLYYLCAIHPWMQGSIWVR